MKQKGRIKKILWVESRGKDLVGEAVLEDGTIGSFWVGGDVDVFFDSLQHKIKLHVKWQKSKG